MSELILNKIFTSYTNDGDIISASSERNSYEAWKAFDGVSNSGYWSTALNVVRGTLEYKFSEPKKVNKYYITNGNNTATSPKDWTFEGSNDGVDWTVLDIQSNVLFTDRYTELSFNVNNDISYLHYRLNISSNNGSTTLSISEVKLVNVSLNKFLILSNNGIAKSINNELIDNTPKLTSASQNGYVAKQSSSLSGQAWNVFDGISTGGIILNNAQGWISLELPTRSVINKYSIYHREGFASTQAPKDWTFEGSNDELIWTILDTKTNVTDWVDSQNKDFEFDNNVSYKYYRINITKNTSDNSTQYTGINELRLFERSQKLTILNNTNENNFIKYGLDKSTQITLNTDLTNKVFIEQSPTTLGSGKVFSKTIDTTKTPIKKVSIN